MATNIGTKNGVHNLLNLKALAALDDKIFHGRMEFDMGVVGDPKYGSGHLKGAIPLLLPQGEYIRPSAESKEKAFQFLVKWSEKNGLKYDTKTVRDEKFKMSISLAAHTAKGDVNDPVNLSIVAMLIAGYFIDDVQQETGFFSQFIGEDLDGEKKKFFSELARDILEGKYREAQELPKLDYPMFEPLPLLLFLIFELCRELPKTSSYFGVELEQCAQAFVALTDVDILNECSERTYLTFRGMDAGSILGIEMVAIGQRLDLKDEIRTNCLFIRLREAYGCVMALMNDLLGVRNEFMDENPTNLVLIKVRKLGISLEEATEQVIQLIENEAKDMIICSEKLIEKYPGNDHISRYIQNIKYMFDGNAFMYSDQAYFERSLDHTINNL